MVIWFNSKKARKQLLKYGSVVTFRIQKKKTLGIQHAFYRDFDNKGIRIKFAIVDVNYIRDCPDPIEKCLCDYIHLSGFDRVSEWIKEICSFVSNRKKPEYGYLYRVNLRRAL